VRPMPTGDSPVSSLEQIRRTLATDISYTISRMKVLQRLPGNPLAINYRWIDDGAVALMARLPAFCRVVGLRAGHEPHIEGIASWYREHGAKPKFEMVPGHYVESLGRALTQLGYFQSGFHVSLVGEPAQTSGADEPIVIEPVTAANIEDFLEAYVAGWGIAEKDQAQFKFNVRPWLNQAGWSLYVGRWDGQPAAAATLYLKDGVGYLADAATSPAFRGRGFQSALLRQRIGDAGADIVFSGATPFSSNHRNMERAGMRVQFTRSLWTAG
jgi:ribosomal protein S18 acetylase RimI-like enzyme